MIRFSTGRVPRLRRLLCSTPVAFVLLIGGLGCSGPPIDEGTPAHLEGSRDERFAEIRSSILSKVEAGEIPSMAVAVAQDGKVLWQEGLGWADREAEVAATSRTVYALGSLSKSITGTALMILIERGDVGLEDPVGPYLGAAAPPDDLGTSSAIRVKHVVSMTAAIPHLWRTYRDDDPGPRLSTSELIARYGFSVAPPGETFLYSNLAFAFPEQIIESVTGQSYERFLRERLFLPLGMKESGVRPQAGPRARKYDSENEPLEADYAFLPTGGGGLSASVHDLLRYGLFHLKTPLEDQTPVLTDDSLDRIHRADDSTLPSFRRYNFGWGALGDGRHRTLISDGRISGANSALLLLPEWGIAVACVSNITGGETLTTAVQIADALVPGYAETFEELIGPLEEADDPQVPYETVPLLAGEWRGEVRTIEGEIPVTMFFSEDDRVVATIGDQEPAELVDLRFVDRPPTVVNGIRFGYRILSGSIDARIPTSDTAGDPEHRVLLSLRHNGSELVGTATARGEDFYLPSFARLSRVRGPS